ncbi:helix-turn-helix transcriptional regulator [Glaciihabitans sp. dw_435]|uniref:ArsR/SmtB family transcription factor n=1 Tax=Glaciihabitans sp. dw_435 TaxID=2720081 RepID=UPI001BD489EF|nr:helix-turn-helix domain-containing protein [Glaciihabitans sp. dw_435]
MSNVEQEPQPRGFPIPDIGDIQLIDVLHALADPARLSVVQRLADNEFHPCSVEEYDVNVHKSTLSYHFKTLREAGITETRVSGRTSAVRLRRDDLNARFPGLIDTVITASATS